jgi:hypothetical protein
MLYPSGFANGYMNLNYPAQYPYEVYKKSLEQIKNRIDMRQVRPWIQAFRDYKKKRLKYGKKEIQAQIQACDEAKTNGWMLWSPSSKYFIHHYK